jgi:hypothetical protein
MAVPANTYQRTNITHEFEDVRDVIEMVSPDLTPVYSNGAKVSVENTLYEWHIDEYRDASTSNAFKDGAEFAPAAVTPTVRFSNECQIQRADFLITRRARIINKAGQRDELARQVTKHGVELRLDVEQTLLNNQIAVSDNGSVAPKLAGLPTWVPDITNASHGDYGDGGSGNSTLATLGGASGASLKTDGTKRAISEDGILALVEQIVLDSRVMPNVWMVDVNSKRKISQYMFSSSARIATPYQDHGRSPRGGLTVIGAVDKYISDYVTLDIVPNIFLPKRLESTGYDHWLYNTDHIECGMFDPFSTNALAQRGDTFDRLILVDHTLIVRNPYTLATFADVDETLAMIA